MAAQRKDHPVIAGLVAMVCVSLAIAVVLGVGALLASRTLGLDGGVADGAADVAADDESSLDGGETMFLPTPEPTDQSTGPLVTLQPRDPVESRSTNTTGATGTAIVLSAGQTAVAPMQQIDLTGSYPGGEGAVLQVQRFTDGSWSDFPVTARVSGDTFASYIQTGQLGEARFRVSDTDTGTLSNEVVVTIG